MLWGWLKKKKNFFSKIKWYIFLLWDFCVFTTCFIIYFPLLLSTSIPACGTFISTFSGLTHILPCSHKSSICIGISPGKTPLAIPWLQFLHLFHGWTKFDFWKFLKGSWKLYSLSSCFFVNLSFFLLPLNFSSSLADCKIYGSIFLSLRTHYSIKCWGEIWHWLTSFPFWVIFLFVQRNVSLTLKSYNFIIRIYLCIHSSDKLFLTRSVPFQSMNRSFLFWKSFPNCFWNFFSSIIVIFFKPERSHLLCLHMCHFLSKNSFYLTFCPFFHRIIDVYFFVSLLVTALFSSSSLLKSAGSWNIFCDLTMYSVRFLFYVGYIVKIFFSLLFVFFLLFIYFCFSGLHLQHMEFPRLGVELEPQLPASATTTAMRDLIYIFNLHHSSQQCWILNPLIEARNLTHILLHSTQVHYHWATTGTPY